MLALAPPDYNNSFFEGKFKQVVKDGKTKLDLIIGSITWNSALSLYIAETGKTLNPDQVVVHEMDHGQFAVTNPTEYYTGAKDRDKQFEHPEERRIIAGSEQDYARETGRTKPDQVTRNQHNGKQVYNTGNYPFKLLFDWSKITSQPPTEGVSFITSCKGVDGDVGPIYDHGGPDMDSASKAMGGGCNTR